MDPPNADSLHDQINTQIELFTRHEQALALFIRSMLPDLNDVEEVLQRTNIVVWKKIDRFDPKLSFRSWAFGIARLEALKYLDERRRDRVRFSHELVATLADEAVQMESRLEERRAALRHCVNKLPDRDASLIKDIYERGLTVPDTAERTGRKPTNIYRSLRRIRDVLFECIESVLSSGAST